MDLICEWHEQGVTSILFSWDRWVQCEKSHFSANDQMGEKKKVYIEAYAWIWISFGIHHGLGLVDIL